MGRHPLNRLSLSPHTPHDLAEGDASPSTGESKKRKTQKLHGRLARFKKRIWGHLGLHKRIPVSSYLRRSSVVTVVVPRRLCGPEESREKEERAGKRETGGSIVGQLRVVAFVNWSVSSLARGDPCLQVGSLLLLLIVQLQPRPRRRGLCADMLSPIVQRERSEC